jgi:hypothetical protein
MFKRRCKVLPNPLINFIKPDVGEVRFFYIDVDGFFAG